MLVLLKEDESGGPVVKSALLPIDLEKLVLSLGARIIKVEELGGVRLGNPWAERDVTVPGLFDRLSKTIFIAENEPIARQRYTVAHEVAHFLYDSKPTQLRERVARGRAKPEVAAGQNKQEERIAEIFAAESVFSLHKRQR
jgi:Zn-dependent peptidase ImmA (M78 family)